MFGAQTRLTDTEGRATPVFFHFLQGLGGTTSTGLAGRVTSLEISVAALSVRMTSAEAAIDALELTVSTQAASIAANTAAIADLELNDVWVDLS